MDYSVENKHFRAGSHLPVLSTLLRKTDGAILELGCGYYSTPLLAWHSMAYGNLFKSYENDKTWAEKFADLGTEYVTDWDAVPIDDLQWGIALIDHRPAIRRHKDAIRLKDNATFIVLHDTEPEIDKFYAYRRVWGHFKYVTHFKRVKPYTTVVSNFVNVRDFFKY